MEEPSAPTSLSGLTMTSAGLQQEYPGFHGRESANSDLTATFAAGKTSIALYTSATSDPLRDTYPGWLHEESTIVFLRYTTMAL